MGGLYTVSVPVVYGVHCWIFDILLSTLNRRRYDIVLWSLNQRHKIDVLQQWILVEFWGQISSTWNQRRPISTVFARWDIIGFGGIPNFVFKICSQMHDMAILEPEDVRIFSAAGTYCWPLHANDLSLATCVTAVLCAFRKLRKFNRARRTPPAKTPCSPRRWHKIAPLFFCHMSLF